MKIFKFGKFTCKLGETAKENWSLLDIASGGHYFLHLSSFSSGYVILECDDTPSIDMLQIAAKICRDNTKYRNLINLKVDYCRCDNLEKGDKTGVVHFKSNRKVKKIKLL